MQNLHRASVQSGLKSMNLLLLVYLGSSHNDNKASFSNKDAWSVTSWLWSNHFWGLESSPTGPNALNSKSVPADATGWNNSVMSTIFPRHSHQPPQMLLNNGESIIVSGFSVITEVVFFSGWWRNLNNKCSYIDRNICSQQKCMIKCCFAALYECSLLWTHHPAYDRRDPGCCQKGHY